MRRPRVANEPSLNRMATSLPSVTARESAQRVQRAAQLCLDMKANDVVVLNLAGVTDMTDYFVIASGTSDTHVRSIGEHVISEMKKVGLTVHHTEGLQQGRWVLLDFFDFVVHIFHPTLRSFYQIERLWSDAETVALEPQEDGKSKLAARLDPLRDLLCAPRLDAQQYFGMNQVQYKHFDWRVIETEHFLVHYYPEERAGAMDEYRMAEAANAGRQKRPYTRDRRDNTA